MSLVQPDDTELTVTILSSAGPRRVIWIPSVHGQPGAERALLSRLAREGIEIWLADLLSARFLPRVNSSMDHLPPSDVTALAQAACSTTGKRIFLAGMGRAAVPVVRAAASWKGADGARLTGLVLLWPNLY